MKKIFLFLFIIFSSFGILSGDLLPYFDRISDTFDRRVTLLVGHCHPCINSGSEGRVKKFKDFDEMGNPVYDVEFVNRYGARVILPVQHYHLSN